MNKAEAIRLIDSAYSRMDGACGHTHDWDRYVRLIEEEEYDHRKFKPDGIGFGLTRKQSVRLFAVKEIFERWVPNESERIFTPKAEDFFHVKKSVFGACAIAHLCAEEITKEFPLQYMSHWLKSIDYVELNRDPRQLQTA